MVFQTSPIAKWPASDNMGSDAYEPTRRYIILVVAARMGPTINSQTMGKTIPGGVHDGILRLKIVATLDVVLLLVVVVVVAASSTASSVFTWGQVLDMGFKIRDFNASP